MTVFILVRHGQSEANLNLCFAGQSDPCLSSKGKQQAEKLSEWIIENYKVDKIYSSDLKRAYNTAKPLAEKLNLEIINNKNFREIYAGRWQEQPYSLIKEKYSNDYTLWLNDIGNACCTGGESVKELSQRVFNEMMILGEKEDGSTILISTHATPIRAFQTICEKGDIAFAKDIPWTANTSVSIYVYDKGSFKLIVSGFNDFLGDAKSEFPNSVV